jgi:hypothetical protein
MVSGYKAAFSFYRLTPKFFTGFQIYQFENCANIYIKRRQRNNEFCCIISDSDVISELLLNAINEA